MKPIQDDSGKMIRSDRFQVLKIPEHFSLGISFGVPPEFFGWKFCTELSLGVIVVVLYVGKLKAEE